MNKRSLFFTSLLVTAFLLTLSSCSDDVQSGISGSGAPVLVAGGPISGFGSIIMNGQRYQTDDTRFYVNGEEASETDLQMGYQITLIAEGSAESKTPPADQIRFNTDVQGTITSIDVVNKTVTVLSQTINVSLDTTFTVAGGNPFITLTIGQNIMVSGTRTTQGRIDATRIDLIGGNLGLVTGEISRLNSATGQFWIGQLKIDASQLPDLNAWSNGQVVQVSTSAIAEGFEVTADKVRVLDPSLSVKDGTQLSKKTKIESVNNSGSYPVISFHGYKARVDSNTQFIKGTKDLLKADQAIVLEGIMQNSEILLNSVEFILVPTRVIEYSVASVDVISDGGIPTGKITMSNGAVISADVNTRYQDGSAEQLRIFNLSLVESGDRIKVSHYPFGTTLVSTMIHRISHQP